MTENILNTVMLLVGRYENNLELISVSVCVFAYISQANNLMLEKKLNIAVL